MTTIYRLFRRCTFLPITLLLTASVCLAEPERPKISIDDVLKHWAARVDRVRSVRFSWKDRYTVSKGNFFNPSPEGPDDPHNPKRRVVPPETTTYDQIFSIAISGDNVRQKGTVITVSVDQEVVTQDYVWTLSAGTFKKFRPPAGAPYPRGIIAIPTEMQPPLGVDPNLVPLLFVYRPFDPNIRPIPNLAKRFRIAEERSTVQERECLVLKEEPESPSTDITSIFVDSERDFSVMGISRQINGAEVYRLTFLEYRQENQEWMPIRWKTVFLEGSDGSVTTTNDCEVTDFALNPRIDASEFQQEFPVGTWVNGKDCGEFGYIINKAGDKRAVMRDELASGASYEQLFNTVASLPLAPQNVRTNAWRWIVLVNCALVAIICLFVYLRRKARTT